MAFLRAGLVIVCLALIAKTYADFAYPDFEGGTAPRGLRFLGDTHITACDDEPTNTTNYLSIENFGDTTTTFWVQQGTWKVNQSVPQCSTALRLTRALPHQLGAVWYVTKQHIDDEFETSFSFRISNQSESCEKRVEKDELNTIHYETCSTDDVVYFGEHDRYQRFGGDGFAFVIHNSPDRTFAVGTGGLHMGYGGIENSFAIEFDTFSNRDAEDYWSPHISAHANSVGPNSADSTNLGWDFPYPIQDGNVHNVTIRYENTIRMDYLMAGKFMGSDRLPSYLHSRVGTLSVFVDNPDEPIFCIPIDFGQSLSLDAGRAYVGFTGSTGNFWQIHDIYDWKFCATAYCIVS